MSSSSPLVLDSQALANVLGSDDTTSDFFQEELDLLPRPREDDLLSIASTSTFRSTRSRIASSLHRTFTGASTDSVVLTERKTFTLEQLCGFIYAHPSLQSAGITSCSCYTEPTKARFIPHRFLILELNRKGRQSVWLRLDRRPSNILVLAIGFGVTPANDTAMLASSRTELLVESQDAVEESRLTFTSPGRLSMLRLRLLVVIGVMNHYKLASENCWAFCAFLLSFFRDYDKAIFQIGSLHFPKLAQTAKKRILRTPIFQTPFLKAQAVCHTVFHQQVAPILSQHDPALYVPFSILRGDDISWWGMQATEAARRWEDSDGFNSADGQLLAGRMISALSGSGNFVYQNLGSQLALQTTALCRHVAACAGASWATLPSAVCNDTISLLYRHGTGYLESKPPNPNAALPFFEEVTLLLVPGVAFNGWVCYFHYSYASTLHTLGRLDEAKVVVVVFIEGVRHQEDMHRWHDEMENLRSRGIWHSEFNYLLNLKKGDLPRWEYWRTDWHSFQSSPPSRLSDSLPSSDPLPSTSSDTSGSSLWTAPGAEESEPSIPASFSSNGVDTSAAGGKDSESNDGDVKAALSRSQVQDTEDADKQGFDIEAV